MSRLAAGLPLSQSASVGGGTCGVTLTMTGKEEAVKGEGAARLPLFTRLPTKTILGYRTFVTMRGQRDAIIRRLSEKCGGETGEGEAGAAELTRSGGLWSSPWS